MNDTDWREHVAKFIRTLQIIVGALVAGCVVFLVVALFTSPRPGPAPGAGAGQPEPVLVWVALVFVAAIAIVRAVVPTVTVHIGRRRIAQGTFQLPYAQRKPQRPGLEQTGELGDAGQLFFLYQTKTIIGAALVEGATFFTIIVYFVERHALALGIAAALILAVAAHMPTRNGVIHWIEGQLRLVEEERSRGR